MNDLDLKNKEMTRLAHNSIAKQYYDEYKDDQSDLIYFDEFLKTCGNKILDLGCGMGHYSGYMKESGHEVVGIDFSESMLEIAKRTNPGIRFINSDVCDLPADLDSDFDGTVIAFVLHHLSEDEAKECLTEAHNHMKSEGKLLILFRSGKEKLTEQEPFDPKFTYEITEYTDDKITNLLSECGFETTKIVEKPYIYDPNSVSPTTKVLFATSIQKEIGTHQMRTF